MYIDTNEQSWTACGKKSSIIKDCYYMMFRSNLRVIKTIPINMVNVFLISIFWGVVANGKTYMLHKSIIQLIVILL